MVNEWALLGDGVLGDNIGPWSMCKKLAYFYEVHDVQKTGEVHSQKSGIF